MGGEVCAINGGSGSTDLREIMELSMQISLGKAP